jgi:hypothetical protein
MTGFVNFWAGASGTYIAIAWFAIDWIYLSQKMRPVIRLIGVACTVAAAIVISWIVFRPVPLEGFIVLGTGMYAPDTDVGGMKWKDRFSEARVVISNDTTYHYENLDAVVKTNLLIAQVGVIGSFIQCKSAPALPVKISNESLSVRDNQGKTLRAIPLDPNASMFNWFRIHCDGLLAGDRAEFVLAIVPTVFNRTPTNPKWVTASIKYEGAGREHNKFLSKCFESACADMPVNGD